MQERQPVKPNERKALQEPLSLEDRGHELVLPERAYRREYRPNDHVTRDMAPLGVTQ